MYVTTCGTVTNPILEKYHQNADFRETHSIKGLEYAMQHADNHETSFLVLAGFKIPDLYRI